MALAGGALDVQGWLEGSTSAYALLVAASVIIDVSSSSLSSFEPFLEAGEGTSLLEDLDIATVTLDLSELGKSSEFRVNNGGESVFTGDEDVLSSRELTLGASEGFTSVGDVLGFDSEGDENLSNADSAGLKVSLTPSTSHTGLESISTGAGKHLVDADNVPGMRSDSHVEGFFTALGDQVLVSGNTGGFEGLGGELLLLSRNEMDASRESLPSELLHSTIVHTELGVGYTSVESRFGVRLVFLVSVALGGSASHIVY
jgi:hypothetical protein